MAEAAPSYLFPYPSPASAVQRLVTLLAYDEAMHNTSATPGASMPPATQPASTPATPPARSVLFNRRVLPWVLWDWGSAAFNAVVTTFVFTPYLSNEKFFGTQANALIGWGLALAGLLVALIAPAVGQWADRSGKKNSLLTLTTLVTIVCMALLFLVAPSPSYLWLGVVLLAVGNIVFEIGSVVYNAMVTDISTPATLGRISGFGWGMGYVGGIVLLLILFIGFISPDTGWFGVTSANGMNIRVCMIACALWTLVFSAPLMVLSRDEAPRGEQSRGVIAAYRAIFRSIARLWRADRSTFWFLISSAIYRDGLAGVFAFGGVLAARVFGFTPGEVMIFGIAANVIAGVATIAFGWLEVIIGARRVILMSLTLMIACGCVLFFMHDAGKSLFWVFGSLLCIFVGPVQSSSRTYLARRAGRENSGELFGLYATTGRAVSFLTPALYSAAIMSFGSLAGVSGDAAAHYGILGIIAVLAVGLAAFYGSLRAGRR